MSKVMERLSALTDSALEKPQGPHGNILPAATTALATIILAEQVERIANFLEALPPEKPRKDTP